jgi:hypothetical protein
VLPLLVHRVEIDVETGLQSLLLVLVLARERGDPLERLQGRLLRRQALAHELDDGVGPAGAEVPFAPARRAARPDLPVHVESRADHGGVAEASGQLEEEARGRRRPDDVAVGGDRVAVDRPVRPEILDAVLSMNHLMSGSSAFLGAGFISRRARRASFQ